MRASLLTIEIDARGSADKPEVQAHIDLFLSIFLFCRAGMFTKDTSVAIKVRITKDADFPFSKPAGNGRPGPHSPTRNYWASLSLTDYPFTNTYVFPLTKFEVVRHGASTGPVLVRPFDQAT